jgi:diaminohydroxyphosphoribosylaminopyrimidine deaminase/5-amino-6-(5-phosphoribosylamino)uracil reductase
MARALELAWRGWGRVHPNPLVGAVVLADGEIVGEGWHAEFGAPHAEPVALAAAAERARGATLVVTLEPCAHQGKQPPCVEAVVRAGVRRVVVATADPNPVARGGAERLRAEGVEVEIGLLGTEAADQNAIFVRGLAEPSRPFVALKLATSLDGRIADAWGSSRWISGAAAREHVHWLRAGHDAIAVGGATAAADDPSLTVRGALVPRVAPARVVFAGSRLPAVDSALVRTARDLRTWVVAGRSASSAALAELAAAGVRTLRADSLSAALGLLREEGMRSVLVEGGGRLAAGLLQEDLVDRFYWIQSPVWLGDGPAAVAGLGGRRLGDADRWRIVERRALEADTLLVADRR